MDTGKFEPTTILERPKGLWEQWKPCQRIVPGESLQYKNPVIRVYTVIEHTEKCENPLSNQGPAAG
jgi:hypothetical protein